MGSPHNNTQLMLEFFKAPCLLLYIIDLPNDVICNIVIYTDNTTLYSLVWSGVWYIATTRTELWTQIWFTRHHGLGQKVAFLFHCWKNQLVLFDWSNNTDAIDVKMDGYVIEEIMLLSLKMLKLTFSFKLDWGT